VVKILFKEGLGHLERVPAILERVFGLPELNCSCFVLSGGGFASGNIYQIHGKVKPIFFCAVCLLTSSAKKKVFYNVFTKSTEKNTLQIRSSKRRAKRSTWLFGYRLEGYLVASSVYVGKRLHCGSV
jgi:hypothetical protein